MTANPDDTRLEGKSLPDHDIGTETFSRARDAIFFAAMDSTHIPMLVTDPHRFDNPIVFANRAFVTMSGYELPSLIGRNCRMMQGPHTSAESVDAVRDAVAARRPCNVEILNYRRNGTAFWNNLYIAPVFDQHGELAYFFSTQLHQDQFVELTGDIASLVQRQMARLKTASPSDVVELALTLFDEQHPSDGSKATSGPGFDLAQLRTGYTELKASNTDRNFVIGLAARQRVLSHPEAIMQMTAELVGRKLGVSRVGFVTVHERFLDFTTCWTDGSVSTLEGPRPIDIFGSTFVERQANREPSVVDDCRTDAVFGARLEAIQTVAMIAVPLMLDRQWIASLYVGQPEPRNWVASEIKLLAEIAGLTRDALQRSSSNSSLRQEILLQRESILRSADNLAAERDRAEGAEGMVRQLQKMDAVGQLTGGIAHDFNNMLAVIIGGLDLLDRRLKRGDTDVVKYIDGALDAAKRAALLTERLLAFSRQQPLSPQPLDANRLVTGMADILGRTLGAQTQLETVLAASLWATRADVSQLENAILNLAVNARDAMPGGGKLTVETSNTHVDDAYARQNDLPEGQYVVVAVTDTGSGMSQEVIAKAFDPFFTTKPVGQGTGLGLSQVFGFVRQSGGVVRIYSEVGHGTTIRVFLPRHYGEAQAIAPRVAPRDIKSGSKEEVILVVEDEERVRNHTVDALEELGYTVLKAVDAASALELLSDRGVDVDILFTDIVMPGMTGRQLAEAVMADRPMVKVIYTTGYTRNAVVHNGILDSGTNYLPKPHTIEQLAVIVRRVFDAP